MADCTGQNVIEQAGRDLVLTPLQKVQGSHAALRSLSNACLDIQTKADCAYQYVEKAVQSCALGAASPADYFLTNEIASLCEDAAKLISGKEGDPRAQDCYHFAEEYYLLNAHDNAAAWIGASRVGKLLRGSVSPQLRGTVNPGIYLV